MVSWTMGGIRTRRDGHGGEPGTEGVERAKARRPEGEEARRREERRAREEAREEKRGGREEGGHGSREEREILLDGRCRGIYTFPEFVCA
jgi:hypothetical protein